MEKNRTSGALKVLTVLGSFAEIVKMVLILLVHLSCNILSTHILICCSMTTFGMEKKLPNAGKPILLLLDSAKSSPNASSKRYLLDHGTRNKSYISPLALNI